MTQNPDLLSMDYMAEFDPLLQPTINQSETTASASMTQGPTQEQFQHIFGMREELRMWDVKCQKLRAYMEQGSLQINMLEESIEEIADHLRNSQRSFEKFIQTLNQKMKDHMKSGDPGHESEILHMKQQIDLAVSEREAMVRTQHRKRNQIGTLKYNITENSQELKTIEAKRERINAAFILGTDQLWYG